MNREPILIIADIIQNELGLTDSQVFIYNQDYKLPETSGLFIVLVNDSSEIFSNSSKFIATQNTSQEVINYLAKEEYSINIMSKNSEARTRKEEVVMALISNYAKEQQDKYQFKIAQIPNSFTNVSELEGAGMLNRFVVNLSVLTWQQKTKNIPYFDQFTKQINNG
jgi:hypothetical protein